MTKQEYKQTEVGLIPEDWNLHQVVDLIDLLTDYDANGSFASVAENVKVYDYEKFAWYVRSTDLEKNSTLAEVRYVDEESYKFLKKTALYGGELLFLKRGDIGNVYLFEMKYKYATVAPNLYLLKLNEVSNSTYLYYYFISKRGQSQLKSKNASSTLGALYKDDVKAIYVSLPPTLQEQKAIATALSDVDALISSLEALIEKKKDIKQGAMQQLLTPPHKGGKRLPGFSGEWEERNLGELSTMGSGGTPSSKVSEYYDGNIKWVSITDISKAGKYIDDSAKKITEKGLQNSSARIFPNNTLLLAMYASIGKCCISTDEVTTSQAILGITTNRHLLIEFLYYVLVFKQDDLANQGQQGTQSNLNKGMVQDISINFPKIDEQKKIAQILSDMDMEIEQLEIKKEKYEAIKQGMMQELLTGKTRLV